MDTIKIMKIPGKFKSILEENQALYSIILDIITSFQPVFDDNKLFFFDEYTDHGIKHIESVLASAAFIISEDSFENLTAKDIAVLVLSIILHDIGMHTEFSTFVSLLDGQYDAHKLCLDSKTWRELWGDYLAEAKRFSSQQKRNIFGDEYQPYREPDLVNKDNLTGYDKKLIGEFIRRHHARLAHEIAFNGLVGKNKKIDFGSDKLTSLYRGMAGIVARSHGMNLRNTFSYLENIGHKSWRNPDDVNIIFLMVVLRIADYIQIDTTRVNSFLLKLKTFNSPISLNEHNAHLAIESINFTQPDDEQFYVLCNPANSGMLVKLQNLFVDIQKELDVSWAVLGEVYGFLPKKLKIKFRRITSNLEETTYLAQLPFIPQKISFQVNNELSKLLVAPLYGNRATYGVRELIQNAVDACRERQHLESKNDNYEPKVTVSINRIAKNKGSRFKIMDNGKGMDVDEIIHYFLAIGVSFRKSLTWRKQFVDDKGHTLINRNGRFGIGVLAAFLIGEELTVKTRKYNDKIAYSFTATLDSEFIEIQREQNSNFEVGTTISLVISDEKRKELLEDEKKWSDWYVGESPKVEYILDAEKHESHFKLDRKSFNSFETEYFKNIQWHYNIIDTYSKNSHNKEVIIVVCNDIIISKNTSSKEFKSTKDKKYRFVIKQKPSFLFDDSEGLFPIKLDRNDIDCDELPFETELYGEVAKSFIAYILSIEINITKEIRNFELQNINRESGVLFSKNGYAFNIDYFCDKFQQSKFKLVRILTEGYSINSSILKYDNFLFYLESGAKINLSYSERYVAPEVGGRIILEFADYEKLFNSDKNRISKAAKRNHTIEGRNDKFVIYKIHNFNIEPTLLKIDNLNIIEQCDKRISSIQEIPYDFLKVGGFSKEKKYLKSGEILHNLLTQYIGDDIIIPYDMEERKRKYKKAFEELGVYMEKFHKN